jgi:hypothetical protein
MRAAQPSPGETLDHQRRRGSNAPKAAIGQAIRA